MNPVRKGTTISFREVGNFDQLPLEEATRIIYNELVPACETKGVMLSSIGNNNISNNAANIEKYNEDKANYDLFNVKRIQKAFASIPIIVQSTSQFQKGSYGLKHDVEKHPSQSGEYISNGDLIAAMLLKGFKARFGKKNDPRDMNCEFQVRNCKK